MELLKLSNPPGGERQSSESALRSPALYLATAVPTAPAATIPLPPRERRPSRLGPLAPSRPSYARLAHSRHPLVTLPTPAITIPHPGRSSERPKKLEHENQEHLGTVCRSGVAALWLLCTGATNSFPRRASQSAPRTHLPSTNQNSRIPFFFFFSGVKAKLRKNTRPQEGMEACAAIFTEGKFPPGQYSRKQPIKTILPGPS